MLPALSRDLIAISAISRSALWNDRGVGSLPQWAGAPPQEKRSMQLDNKKIAILATHGFEQSELEVPRDKLKAAGAIVHVISLEPGEIKGWDKKDWGRPVKVCLLYT